MVAGVSFQMHVEQWSVVDSIYFWIVTFTTVGFGDLLQDPEVKDLYMPALVIYRTFGLALLAGVIDSLCAYAAVKKNEMQERKLAGLRPRGCCFCCSRGRVEASPRPKQETPVTAAHSKHTLDSYLAS